MRACSCNFRKNMRIEHVAIFALKQSQKSHDWGHASDGQGYYRFERILNGRRLQLEGETGRRFLNICDWGKKMHMKLAATFAF